MAGCLRKDTCGSCEGAVFTKVSAAFPSHHVQFPFALLGALHSDSVRDSRLKLGGADPIYTRREADVFNVLFFFLLLLFFFHPKYLGHGEEFSVYNT